MPVLKPVPGSDVYLWKYIPSLPGSIAFLALYLVTGSFVGLRMYRTRTYFSTAFVIGSFMEVFGYLFRALSTNDTGSIALYVIQATFILIPPAFFAATIYMCLSRLIRHLSASHLSPVRPEIITKLFVAGDLLSFLIQGNAAGLTVHDNLRTIATVLVIVGLVIQLVSFVLFGVCAVIFHRRFLRMKRDNEHDGQWRTVLYMLYVVSALIVLRSVFRIVEYAFGEEGYPMANEWTLYAFDSVPMLLVTVIFLIWYPNLLSQKKGMDAEGIRLESHAGTEV